MRALLLFFCFAGAPLALADSQPLPSFTSYLKRSPAYVSGQISFEKPHRVFHHEVIGRSLFSAHIRANEPIGIFLTEAGISLTSKTGLRITAAGIPVNITKLSYDDRTGEVSAESSVLGTRLESQWIEARAEEAVVREFGPKLRRAFIHIHSLRSQNSLEEIGQVLNAVVNSFKTERKPGSKPGQPLPTFEGHLTLVTPIASDQAVRMGPVIADLEQGDQLSLSVMIHVPSRKKLQIRGVIFTSSLGILIRRPNSSSENLKTLDLHGFSVTEESGFHVDAQNGIDGVLSGAELLISTLAREGTATGATVVQDFLDEKMAQKVSRFATEHRERLLKAGLTPALVQALSRSDIVSN